MLNKLRGMFPVKVILTLSLSQYRILYILDKIKNKEWISETKILREISTRCYSGETLKYISTKYNYNDLVSIASFRLTIRSLIRRGIVVDRNYHHLSYRYPRNHYFGSLKLNPKLDSCILKFFRKQWKNVELFEDHRMDSANNLKIHRSNWKENSWIKYNYPETEKNYFEKYASFWTSFKNYKTERNSFEKYDTVKKCCWGTNEKWGW